MAITSKTEAAKLCTKCGEFKPLTDFREFKGRSKDGRRPICIECQRAYDREYGVKRRAAAKAKKEGA